MVWSVETIELWAIMIVTNTKLQQKQYGNDAWSAKKTR